MTYLIYKDENGIKVGRVDGRLDEFTKYYPSKTHALISVQDLDFKVIENDQPLPMRLH